MFKDRQDFPHISDSFVLITKKNGQIYSDTFMKEYNEEYDSYEADNDEDYDEIEYWYVQYNPIEAEWDYGAEHLDSYDITQIARRADGHAFVVLE